MQEARAASTLELVVNEQQLQNMSQIDLSRPNEDNHNTNTNSNTNCNNQQANLSTLRAIKELPSRIRDGFKAKLDEAQSKSESRTQYALEIVKAFSGVIIWALCLVCTIIVPIFLLIIGLFNLDNCQDRPQLPYLVFGIGFVMTSSNLFNLALALDLPILTNHRLLSADTKNTISSILNILFNCIVAFLYILTSYMVYTVGPSSRSKERNTPDHGPRAEESSEEDQPSVSEYQVAPNCGGLIYHFTFWSITFTLCLIALISLSAVSLFAYNKYRLAIIRGSTPRSQPNNATNPSMNPTSNGTGSPFGSGTINSRMI